MRRDHHPPLVIGQHGIFTQFEAKLLDEEESAVSYSSTRRAVRFKR